MSHRIRKNWPVYLAALAAIILILAFSQQTSSTQWQGGGWKSECCGEDGGGGDCEECERAEFADSSGVSHHADHADYADTAGYIDHLRDSVAAVLADSCPLCDPIAFRDSVGAVIWDSVWSSATFRDSVSVVLADSCPLCDPVVFRDSVGVIMRDSIVTIFEDSIGTTIINQIPSDLDLVYLDTTVAIGGTTLRYYDLRDKRVSADYNAYRAAETQTSWWAGSHIPTRLLLVRKVGTPTSTLSFVNADSATIWKTYRSAQDSNYAIYTGSGAFQGFRWQDHRLWIVGGGTVCLDFLSGDSWLGGTTGVANWLGGLANGNDNSGFGTFTSGMPLGANSNNDICLWRTNFITGDPPRPMPDIYATAAASADPWLFYWANSAAARVGLKLSAASVFDSALVCEIEREHNTVWHAGWWSDHWAIHGIRLASGQAASWGKQIASNYPYFSNKLGLTTASGRSTRLDWPLTTKIRDIALVENASAFGKRSPVIYAVSDSGLYSLHPDMNAPMDRSGKIRWNSRYQTPYVGGDWIAVLPLTVNAGASGGEDAGTLANDFTISGAPSWQNPAGPYGPGITFTGATDRYYTDADDADYDPADAFSFGAWVRLDSAAASAQVAFSKWDNTTTERTFKIHIDASEIPSVYVYTNANKSVAEASDSLQIGKWYYIVGSYDGSAYLNGWINGRRMAAPTAVTGTLKASTSAAYVGGEANSGAFYTTTRWRGAVQGAWVSHKAITDAEVWYEWERGKRFMAMGAVARDLPDSLTYASSDYYNFAVVGNGDSAYVLCRDIIVGRHANPGPSKLTDATVWQIPGTSGYSLALINADSLKLIQADGVVSDLKDLTEFKEWTVPTSSWQIAEDGTGQFFEPYDAAQMLLNRTMSTAFPSDYWPRKFNIGPGVYQVPNHEIPDSSSWIGSGPLTVLTNKSADSKSALRISEGGAIGNHVYVSDLSVDSKVNDFATAALHLEGAGQNIVCERIYVRNSGAAGAYLAAGTVRDLIVEQSDSYCATIAGIHARVDGIWCKGGGIQFSGDGSWVEDVTIDSGFVFFDAGADSNTLENVLVVKSAASNHFLKILGTATLTVGNVIRNFRGLGIAGKADVYIENARNNSIYNFIGNDTTSTAYTCSMLTAQNNLLSDWRVYGRISIGANCDSVKIFGMWADSLIGDTTQDATHQRAMNLWRKGPSPGTYSP